MGAAARRRSCSTRRSRRRAAGCGAGRRRPVRSGAGTTPESLPRPPLMDCARAFSEGWVRVKDGQHQALPDRIRVWLHRTMACRYDRSARHWAVPPLRPLVLDTRRSRQESLLVAAYLRAGARRLIVPVSRSPRCRHSCVAYAPVRADDARKLPVQLWPQYTCRAEAMQLGGEVRISAFGVGRRSHRTPNAELPYVAVPTVTATVVSRRLPARSVAATPIVCDPGRSRPSQ